MRIRPDHETNPKSVQLLGFVLFLRWGFGDRGGDVFLREVAEDAGEAGHAAAGNDGEIGVGSELFRVGESAA